MLVNVAKSNIGLQISRLQFNHHMLILKGERQDSPRLTLIKQLFQLIFQTYYIHIITHTLSNFVSILNMIKYVKMTITDHFAMLLLHKLPPSVTLLYLTLSFPQATQFHTSPLLSSALPVTFTCDSRKKAASMKVMDLNQQPIVSLCK